MTATGTTFLYVPGDRPDRIAKALASEADEVLIDLEDAVAPDHKELARDSMIKSVAAAEGRAIQVRINPEGTPWYQSDVDAVRTLDPTIGVRLPKCEDPGRVAQTIAELESRPAQLLIESALGVEAAFDLARCHPAVVGIGLGEADLRADLGVCTAQGLLYARSRLVTAAAAAGLRPPVMSVYTDVRDLDGLRRSTLEGRDLGFLGRTAIHPRQLAVIADVFRPDPADIVRAEEILAAAAAGLRQQDGAVALPDGRFVDRAVLRQARRLLDLREH
ncbi:HpcH/HpaI aldolase/citrate lyase family protein [Microlunatus soli]|uniref:Citrate lyase subunit beta / citryl-CoA lyase n=1 Tax=Microlunatus soli TaxID=630515 RepID=A0A1H1YYQ8_9ACTN|nr:CoA ester lyase [Microlunatus soli]SDT26558.1 citrate lyase subunit beta / citryl-CoA lyase [Microlunatus soli]